MRAAASAACHMLRHHGGAGQPHLQQPEGAGRHLCCRAGGPRAPCSAVALRASARRHSTALSVSRVRFAAMTPAQIAALRGQRRAHWQRPALCHPGAAALARWRTCGRYTTGIVGLPCSRTAGLRETGVLRDGMLLRRVATAGALCVGDNGRACRCVSGQPLRARAARAKMMGVMDGGAEGDGGLAHGQGRWRDSFLQSAWPLLDRPRGSELAGSRSRAACRCAASRPARRAPAGRAGGADAWCMCVAKRGSSSISRTGLLPTLNTSASAIPGR